MRTPSTKRRVFGSRGKSAASCQRRAGIDGKEREDRAELDQHLERLAGALEAEQPPGEQQMRGRRHRDEFGHPLDQAEDQSIDDRFESPCRLSRLSRSSSLGLPPESPCEGRHAGSIPESVRTGGRFRHAWVRFSPALRDDASPPPPSPVRRFPLRPPAARRVWRGRRPSSRKCPGSDATSCWRSTRRERCRSSSTRPTGRSSGATVIAEYLHETRGARLGEDGLMPSSPAERAEMRRLVAWFLDKFDAEVTGYLVGEKISKRACAGRQRRRAAGRRGDPRRHALTSAIICAISAIWRRGGTVSPDARSTLCRSRRRRRAVVHRLSGRGAMGRGRDGEGVVRAGEVAPELPAAARRPGARQPAVDPLRRPRLLSEDPPTRRH